MNARNLFLIKGIVGILVLWLIVAGIAKFVGGMKPTPDKIRSYAEKNSLSEIEDPAERKKVIGKVADMLNQLEPSQLREFESDERDIEERGKFFREMTEDEQRFFMEKRIGKAFTQMMQAFNDMDRNDRKTMVERSLKRIRENEGTGPAGERLEDVDPEMVEKIANAGLKSYYQDASAETKLDLAPLMEEMQNVMGTFRGRRGGDKGKK